jgi:CRP-like cAMP-binding protein
VDDTGVVEWELLAGLDEADREAVLAAARRRRYTRNEPLFHEGDHGDSLHLIAEGHVAMRVTTPMGEVATLRIASPGEHLGELAVLSPAPRNATVVALGDVETLSIQKPMFDELRRRHPAVDGMAMEGLVAEVRRLAAQLQETMYVPAPTRVLRRLHDLVARFGRTVPLTQDDLAGLAGTSRKTVNEVLRDIEDRGLVRLGRGAVEVLDPAGLDEIALSPS